MPGVGGFSPFADHHHHHHFFSFSSQFKLSKVLEFFHLKSLYLSVCMHVMDTAVDNLQSTLI